MKPVSNYEDFSRDPSDFYVRFIAKRWLFTIVSDTIGIPKYLGKETDLQTTPGVLREWYGSHWVIALEQNSLSIKTGEKVSNEKFSRLEINTYCV